MKFHPGFFGDDPFKIIDGKMSRKRSNEKKHNNGSTNAESDDKLFFYENLPKIIEMPKLVETATSQDIVFPKSETNKNIQSIRGSLEYKTNNLPMSHEDNTNINI